MTNTKAPAAPHSLTANEYLTYVGDNAARHMREDWLTKPSAALIQAASRDELEALALHWVDWYGADVPSVTIAEMVLAELIADGPAAWQAGVL